MERSSLTSKILPLNFLSLFCGIFSAPAPTPSISTSQISSFGNDAEHNSASTLLLQGVNILEIMYILTVYWSTNTCVKEARHLPNIEQSLVAVWLHINPGQVWPHVNQLKLSLQEGFSWELLAASNSLMAHQQESQLQNPILQFPELPLIPTEWFPEKQALWQSWVYREILLELTPVSE